jgi:putative inorganic carbon (HCO3(-)) transporter
MLGGSYSNPNDLALAIVISLPLCLALLFLTKSRVWKGAWALSIIAMIYVVLLTGSRGGFLSLVTVTAVCLWELAIRGRRRYLLVVAILVGMILWQSSSGMLSRRLKGTFDFQEDTASSYESAQERQALLWRSVEITKEHPLFGIGPGNFPIISGSWHVTHNSFTEMSSEGGMPAFVLYVLILWCAFKNIKAIKRFSSRDGESILLARVLHASLAGYVIGSLFSSEAYQLLPYFLVAYTTTLFWVAKRSASYSDDHKSVSQATAEKEICANTTESEMSWHGSSISDDLERGQSFEDSLGESRRTSTTRYGW